MSKTKCKDHLGNEFSSIAAMCRYWNINTSIYNNRMRMKWSLEKTLTTPIKTCRSVIDDKGIEYKSIKELAKAYNLTEATIYYRLQKGWDIKDVISKKPDKRTLTGINPAAVECYDHLGNKYTDGELLRLIEVGASCFNLYCIGYDDTQLNVLHNVHRRIS